MKTYRSCFIKSVIKNVHGVIPQRWIFEVSISKIWPSNTIFEKINLAFCEWKDDVGLLVCLKTLHVWVIENSEEQSQSAFVLQ